MSAAARAAAEEAIRNAWGEAEWPEPQPMMAKFEPSPYPVDALPDTIRNAVEEVQSFVKAPFALVAASALAAVSVAVQCYTNVRRAERLVSPASLFLLSVADSGERKTTCDGFFLKAVKDYETKQAEAAKPLISAFRADTAIWEAKHAALRDAIKTDTKAGKPTACMEAELRELEGRKPVEPRIPAILRGDDTPEALAKALAEEWPAAGVISSEAGIVLGSHGMGRDNIMRNLAQLNVLWDGGEIHVGRKTSTSFTVKGARVTVGLMVQDAVLREYLAKAGAVARGSGFLARFLLAWPVSTQGTRFYREPPKYWPALTQFHRRMSAILELPIPVDDYGTLTLPELHLTDEAKAAWIRFHDDIEVELAAGGELHDIRDIAAKAADNATRLAASFHTIENGPGGVIDAETFEGASRLAAWHLTEARRFFVDLSFPAELVDAAALDKWLLAHCRREVATGVKTSFALQNVVPHRLRKSEKLEAAIAQMAELGRARLKVDGRTKFIQINPALLEGAE